MIQRHAQFSLLEKGLGIISPPHFVYDFRRATRNLGAEGISWNRETSINLSCATYKRSVRREKYWCFFLQDALKTAF